MSSRLYSINKYINSLATKMFGNQTLCKYLYYDEDDPQSEADISDTTILYTDKDNQRLLFKPFVIAIEDFRMTKLAIVIEDVSVDTTSYFKLVNIDCIIACHNDLWNVTVDTNNLSTLGISDIGIRPLLIWDELDSIIVGETSKGIGSDRFSYVKLMYFNDNFSGYRICYKSISLPI